MTYDGNVLFEVRPGAWAFGIGLRADTAVYAATWSPSTTVRPYAVLAKCTEKGLSTVKVILPGNDGWRYQVGLLGQHDFKFVTVNGYRVALYVTAGLFSYHESEPALIPTAQVHGVVTYTYVDAPRKLGGMAGIGLKFYFQ